jgi:hypothetical protein
MGLVKAKCKQKNANTLQNVQYITMKKGAQMVYQYENGASLEGVYMN